MALKPDIALSRKKSFRDPHGVEHGPENVQQCHKHEPIESRVIDRRGEAFRHDVVTRRNNARHRQSQEHTSSDWAKIGLRKLLPRRDDYATNTQNDDRGRVCDFRFSLAVEPVK